MCTRSTGTSCRPRRRCERVRVQRGAQASGQRRTSESPQPASPALLRAHSSTWPPPAPAPAPQRGSVGGPARALGAAPPCRAALPRLLPYDHAFDVLHRAACRCCLPRGTRLPPTHARGPASGGRPRHRDRRARLSGAIQFPPAPQGVSPLQSQQLAEKTKPPPRGEPSAELRGWMAQSWPAAVVWPLSRSTLLPTWAWVGWAH